jgi:Ca-activated chloride channel homolog
MRFGYPFLSICLLLPLSVIFFYWWAHRRTTRDLEVFAQKSLLTRIVDYSGQRARQTQRILRVIGLVFLILALMGPQWGYQWEEVKHKGLEIVFALDTSKSMLAVDIKPNRLERAKLAVKDLLKRLPGDKIALVAFSGTSFLQCPLTLDYNAFGISLDALSVNSIPRGGTAIGEAINVARGAFKSGSSGSKILILITDGENHEGDPAEVAKEAVKEGITTYTIGIGSTEGDLIVTSDDKGNSSYLKDTEGNVVKSSLNEGILRDIAKAGGGAYFRSSGPSLGLEDLYWSRLATQNKAEVSSRMQKNYLERYQIPLLIAFLLLVIEFLYDKGIRIKLRRTKGEGESLVN